MCSAVKGAAALLGATPPSEKDAGLAVDLLVKSCNSGRAKSCTTAGVLYARGEHVPKDMEVAVTLFDKGCEGGDGAGCFFVATGLARAKRDATSVAKARELYLRGCDLSDAMSCRMAGKMLQGGVGGNPDATQASALAKKACELGDKESCAAPVADSSEGGTRMKCPHGETPTAVRLGCMCGSTILNPCKTGGTFPTVEGDSCVFQCPAESASNWEPKTEEEKCLKKCNDESGWRFMGQCQMTCAEEAKKPKGSGKPAPAKPAPDPKKKARAALPGLFAQCRVLKAKILSLRSQVIAAARARNAARVQELQPKMQEASDELQELGNKINEKISIATDEEEPDYGRLTLEGRKACFP